MDDPRFVITYGKYVGPDKPSSIGSLIAFLSVYCGLHEADRGEMGKNGYRLFGGKVIAKVRGEFEHPIMGWVPLIDFVISPDVPNPEYYSEKTDRYERNQAEFLKALLSGEIK